jgi:hypothetical protein
VQTESLKSPGKQKEVGKKINEDSIDKGRWNRDIP